MSLSGMGRVPILRLSFEAISGAIGVRGFPTWLMLVRTLLMADLSVIARENCDELVSRS